MGLGLEGWTRVLGFSLGWYGMKEVVKIIETIIWIQILIAKTVNKF